MGVKLKPIHEQVVVITGASSGIGLATARLLAKNGAKLVLLSRSEDDLKKMTDELNGQSKTAAYVAGDVADEATVRRAAETAVREFGHLDTWINNAVAALLTSPRPKPTMTQRARKLAHQYTGW